KRAPNILCCPPDPASGGWGTRASGSAPGSSMDRGVHTPRSPGGRSAAVNAPDIVAVGALGEEELAVTVDLDHARLPLACDQDVAVGQPLGVIGVGEVVLPVHLAVAVQFVNQTLVVAGNQVASVRQTALDAVTAIQPTVERAHHLAIRGVQLDHAARQRD